MQRFFLIADEGKEGGRCFSLLTLKYKKMTREELDTYIDTNITNKTAPGSISGVDEGSALKAVADYADQVGVPTMVRSSLTLSSTPQVLTGDINTCNSPGNGIAYLPENTTIGKTIIVIANQKCFIRANVANTNFLYLNYAIATNSVMVSPNTEMRFVYIGSGYWQAESVMNTLEYCCQLYQDGTNNISPQSAKINTIIQGISTDYNYRDVVFARTGVGTYTVTLNYKTSGFVNTSRCALFFGDNVCRVTETSTGSDGTFNYIKWTFKTYTIAGVVSDDQFMGNNGTYMSLKIYP